MWGKKRGNAGPSPMTETTNEKKIGTSNKVFYQYWWSSQILILCSLHQVDDHRVHVVYKLVAQEEVIDQLKRDRKYRQPKK